MMLETETLGIFTVHFRHETAENAPRETHCVIHTVLRNGKCKGDLCHVADALRGMARCAPRDQFSRDRGRKVALSHALKSLPRQSRAEIWTAYFNFIGHF